MLAAAGLDAEAAIRVLSRRRVADGERRTRGRPGERAGGRNIYIYIYKFFMFQGFIML